MTLSLIGSVSYASRVGISPVYIIQATCCFLFFIILLLDRTFKFSRSSILMAIYLIWIIAFYSWRGYTPSVINLLISLTTFIIILESGRRIEARYIARALAVFLCFCTFLFSLEAYLRLSNPGVPEGSSVDIGVYQGEKIFYLYKFNSFMFNDSNATACALLCIIFVVYAYGMLNNRTQRFFLIFFNILLLLTFSRAAILSGIIGQILISYRIKYFAYALGAAILMSTPLWVNFLLEALAFDGSASTKMREFNVLREHLTKSAALDILFGVGPNAHLEDTGTMLHIAPVSYLVGFGLAGSLVLCALILFLYRESGTLGRAYLITVIVNSMSYLTYTGTPFLVVPIAVLLLVERNKKEKKLNRRYDQASYSRPLRVGLGQ